MFPPHYQVFAFDWVRDPEQDIRPSSPFGVWVETEVDSGIVKILIVMPKCASFSRARGRPLPDGTPGPPVVRSFEEPYGIQEVLARDPRLFEMVQADNDCHIFSIRLCKKVCRQGGICFYEQPDVWEGTVSVFDWREFAELQAQAQGRLFRTSQGDFGAPSVKPTALWSNAELEACISNTDRGAALPQLTEDGRFATGRSEEYPPLFCRAIVWDLVTAWDARSSAILAQQVHFF